MILDIALLAIGIIAIATGYNRGGIATLFSIIGYFEAELRDLLQRIGTQLIGKA